jgi:hypothetical protein
MRFDDPRAHHVQRAEMLKGAGPADGIVVPVALGYQGTGRAGRRAAERGDPFRGLVNYGADRLDLRVEHGVDGDEVRAGHVPVHVLEGQCQGVERVQPVLQQLDDPFGTVALHSWHGVRDHESYFPIACDLR